jgi:hypothetical protein
MTQVYSIFSEELVRPAFYDVVLTSKSVKDEESIKMLDILYQNRVYDIANYFEDLGLSGLFEASAEHGNNNFSRGHRSVKTKFTSKIREIFKKFSS